MECEDLRQLQQWVLERRGAGITFEFIPVVSSKETQKSSGRIPARLYWGRMSAARYGGLRHSGNGSSGSFTRSGAAALALRGVQSYA
jgi:Protein of unknown function (DUF3303)